MHWRHARLFVLVGLLRVVADLPVVWMLLSLHLPREGSGGGRAAAFNAGLFFLFGTIHSVLARDGPRSFMARWVGAHYARATYVAIAGLTLSCVLYLWRPLAGTWWRATGAAYWVLTSIFVAAIAGLVYTATFIDYPEFLGIRPLLRAMRGLPPKPPVFSARGPYAHCRHPMYSFLLAALWVGPVMTAGRAEFAAIATAYLLAGTLLEERNFRRELGAVYDAYATQVPMWIPRLSAWIPPGDVSSCPTRRTRSTTSRSDFTALNDMDVGGSLTFLLTD